MRSGCSCVPCARVVVASLRWANLANLRSGYGLQPCSGSDEPARLATPAQPAQVQVHQAHPEENCAPFVELDKTQSSQNPEQPLAKPDSIGEPEPPGCMDISPDLSGLTESTGSSDFSVGPSGLLQPTVSSDEPINLATPAQPVRVAKHQTRPEENCAPFVELDKTQDPAPCNLKGVKIP